MRLSLTLFAASLLALAAPGIASAIPPPIGGLSAIPGGCISDPAVAGCAADPGAGDATAVAVSANGKALYVVQGTGGPDNSMGAVLAYARDPQTGLIGQRISCRADSVSGLPGCVSDPSLYHARGLAAAPDGHGIYVIGEYGGGAAAGAIVSFATDPATGAIGAPTSCFLETSNSPCGAVASHVAHALQAPSSVTVSADGKTVYTSASGTRGGLAAFARLSTDGSLTAELRCVAGIASASGGDGGTGKCDLTDAAVSSAWGVAANDKAVYIASDQGTGGNGNVVAYARDAGAGTITSRLNCFSEASFTGCAGRFGLVAPQAVSAAPDGKTIYAGGLDAALTGGQLTTIRLASDGSLSLVAGCLDSKGQDTCTKTVGVHNPIGFAYGPDGNQLYTADIGGGGNGVVSAFGLTQALPQAPALTCSAGVATTGCTTLGTVEEPGSVAISPDGRFVYSASRSGTGSVGAIQAFARELPPTCVDSSASTTAGVPVNVPLTCSDPNGDPLGLNVAAAPAHGSLGPVDQAAATVTSTPNPGYVGHDSFTYVGSDGRVGTTPSTASVDVSEAPPAPGPGPQPGPEPSPGPDPTPSPTPSPATCKVPKLTGLTLAKAKKRLARAHCRLGKVTKPKHRRHGLVVVKQSPKPGATTTRRVKVKLARRPRR
jgi:hypothetical protein